MSWSRFLDGIGVSVPRNCPERVDFREPGSGGRGRFQFDEFYCDMLLVR